MVNIIVNPVETDNVPCYLCGYISLAEDSQHSSELGNWLCKYCYSNVPFALAAVKAGIISSTRINNISYNSTNWNTHPAIVTRLKQLSENSNTPDSKWNSICIHCGSPAYIGLNSIECSKCNK